MRYILIGFLCSLVNASENWPEYRGPTADGHSDSTGLPVSWNETRNVKWKTAIHGRAWSSPVVWGKQVWLTTAARNGKELSVLCVERDSGKVLFDKKLFDIAKPQFAHSYNSYASPSPVIEEGRVYVSFGSPGNACLNTETFEVIWQRSDLECNHFRGAGSSPVLYGDLLILTMDGSDHHFLIALDKKTGKTVWRRDRSTHFGDLKNGRPMLDGDLRKSYATPFFIEVNGNTQMISPGAKAAWSYEPLTGKEIWQVRYRNHSSASRTLFGHGMLFVNTGYSRAQLYAIKPDGKGDVTQTHVAWKLIKGVSNKPSPVLVGDHLYMVTDKGGIISCVDAKSGKVVWQERIGGAQSSSLIYADGRIYTFGEDGRTVAFQPGTSFKKIGESRLDGGFMSSPAVAGSSFFLRTKTHLYRIDRE
ncbi:MAG: PQQ-binding-like beta-propeller repeat protein [Planctomycetota bacterium]|jgi:outer membrane protein assembly factor BamB|nr:PQQ-binding-like beta-propeller repeat protein [Planctomycetota bacterium]MDP7134217.1 PQQ-binding-like beta-propeller repeat protein [Planctomycetota bacterium]MDP7249706.1 PQQ-binding-like beta-propeller repeat protein [Planctomycetota bacterium]